MENFITVISSIVALVAAMLATGMAYINMVLSKESKISEFRQKWIDDFRNDLTKFFGAFRTFGRALEEENARAPHKAAEGYQISNAQAAEYRYVVAEMFFKIRLRLNPQKPLHVTLVKKIDAAVTAQQDFIEGKGTLKEAFTQLDSACESAIPLLKFEWDRVKEGEPSFHRARRGVGQGFVLVIGIAALIIAIVLFSALALPTPKPVASEKPVPLDLKITVPGIAPAPLPSPTASQPSLK